MATCTSQGKPRPFFPASLVALLTTDLNSSSNAMPKAVRKAIAEAIEDMQDMGITCVEDAQRYVEDMFESGKRGGEESW
jgi:hypothetical protein